MNTGKKVLALAALIACSVSSQAFAQTKGCIELKSMAQIAKLAKQYSSDCETLAKALTSIGNMGLENELLGLLEDLTTCRADMLEAEANAPGPESEPAP